VSGTKRTGGDVCTEPEVKHAVKERKITNPETTDDRYLFFIAFYFYSSPNFRESPKSPITRHEISS
jgi:hypothetical protein